MSRNSSLDHASDPGRTAPPLEVQLRPLEEASDFFFEAGWRDLDRRSLHHNPFLSPSLLLSPGQICLQSESPQLLTVIDGNGRWYAAGLFEVVGGSRQLPLRHLQAVRAKHSYLSGLLLDPARAGDTISAAWRFLESSGIHGLSFPQFAVSSRLGDLLAAYCASQQFATTVDDVQHRASVEFSDASNTTGISEKRGKSLQKGRRALARHGVVSTRFRGCSHDDHSAIDQFLYLETLGWKGDLRQSLSSCPGESEWFRRLAISLSSQDRVRFAELLIDDRVIASMCLLRAQSDYFAFKVGWDPQFERGCPGFLLAAEIRARLGDLPGCRRIDGCARPGSFLDHVWPGRIEIGNALFATTRLGSVMATGTHWARKLLRKWRGRADGPPGHSAVISREAALAEPQQ